MVSECPVLYLLICAIASSTPETTLMDTLRSRYSLPQSSSVAGTALSMSEQPFSSARISTWCSASFFPSKGRSLSATASCTSTDSQALQTPILCVFAFSIISTAIFRSADSSTKTWQFPVPVSITGTVAFCTTL